MIDKIIVDGYCRAEAVVIDHKISFFGEVNPRTGKTTEDIYIGGKALIFPGTRGSTVGTYIIYGLKYYGHEPACMIVYEAEPILIAGAILADIPLFLVKREYKELVKHVKNKEQSIILHERGREVLIVE
ncbi:MAG: DUF126 domain-containing protein [Crenarchaeota archaeon]|nr:DUF126 domain-containing protein [Thermoproteota archaeon]